MRTHARGSVRRPLLGIDADPTGLEVDRRGGVLGVLDVGLLAFLLGGQRARGSAGTRRSGRPGSRSARSRRRPADAWRPGRRSNQPRANIRSTAKSSDDDERDAADDEPDHRHHRRTRSAGEGGAAGTRARPRATGRCRRGSSARLAGEVGAVGGEPGGEGTDVPVPGDDERRGAGEQVERRAVGPDRVGRRQVEQRDLDVGQQVAGDEDVGRRAATSDVLPGAWAPCVEHAHRWAGPVEQAVAPRVTARAAR